VKTNHVVWYVDEICKVPRVRTEQTCQVLRQAVGWGLSGAHNGPQENPYLTGLQECIKPWRHQILWQELLADLQTFSERENLLRRTVFLSTTSVEPIFSF
jgi:hypothetical protein